jgi:hypothetical protein
VDVSAGSRSTRGDGGPIHGHGGAHPPRAHHRKGFVKSNVCVVFPKAERRGWWHPKQTRHSGLRLGGGPYCRCLGPGGVPSWTLEGAISETAQIRCNIANARPSLSLLDRDSLLELEAVGHASAAD